MDHRSILDVSSVPSTEGDMAGGGASRPLTASVSAGIAAANAHLPKSLEAGPRFPGEDGGLSLAKMAQDDLDAALQLLAERAQYITGATGAAIALRRGEHPDMLCRASAGANAPELGALLSMEYGLSGESVRTRQALRCDDTESDPRVNREGCRHLGIASVVVMPVVSEQHVLGVFELFSGKPRAFEERDLSALQRLSEMVETAVKHAVAAQSLPAVQEPAAGKDQPSGDAIEAAAPVEAEANALTKDRATVLPENTPPPEPVSTASSNTTPEKTEPEKTEPEKTEPEKTEPEKTEPEKADPEKTEPESVLKNPLFWSAAIRTSTSTTRVDEPAGSIPAPVELRNLQKCKACGFPVSQGRTLCVECEEKQFRGQLLPQAAASVVATAPEPHLETQQKPEVIDAPDDAPEILVSNDSFPSPGSTPVPVAVPANGEAVISAALAQDSPQAVPQKVSENVSTSDDSTLFLSSAAPSESWLAANKYVLGALLVVAAVIGVIVWLR